MVGALDHVPENKNFLSPFGFQFSVKKCQNVNFFVQAVNVPAMSMKEWDAPNPFVKIPYGGEHIEYGDLSVTFKIDEDLVNYLEIHNWIKQMGFPDAYTEYKQIASKPLYTGEGLISDNQLLEIAEPLKKSGYGDYLINLIQN